MTNRKRNIQINVRLTEQENAALERLANPSGETPRAKSAVIRWLIAMQASMERNDDERNNFN